MFSFFFKNNKKRQDDFLNKCKKLKKYKSLPIYKLFENSGPRHKPTFNVGVRLKYTKFINAKGNSKKEAQQKAAALFLTNIEIL